MLLDLSRIRAPLERYEKTYQADAFPVDDSFRVAGPVALAFDIRKDKQQFQLSGRVQTTLELPCSRCLEPFMWPVDALFDLRYLPQTLNTSADEREIQEDDLSTAFYEDDEIDLGQLMREQFLLSLPMKPLCSDACHGLCPDCGTNLNRGSCDCTRTWDDPRLAALREIRKP
ncbi:MAG TPA: DUF177 domain-containing protein [Vicinamibacterales bacterium]